MPLPFEDVTSLPLNAKLTFRLAEVERTRLKYEANSLGISTGRYLRLLTVNEQARQKLAAIIERQNHRRQFADILVALGKSRIASNLNQLAYAANTGSLDFTPEVITQINEAYDAIMDIRALLIKETGMRQ